MGEQAPVEDEAPDVNPFAPDPVSPLPAEVRVVWGRGMAMIPQRPTPRGNGKWGKRPLHDWQQYQDDRNYDLYLVPRWHRWQPAALWAIVTGDVSGVIVLDFDGEAGMATLHKLGLKATTTTPSGGAHVWVQSPAMRLRYQPAGLSYPGMEVKAEGGLATFYGTMPDGTSYKFDHQALDDWKIYDWWDLPEKLRAHMEAQPWQSPKSAGTRGVRGSAPTEAWVMGKLTEAIAKVEGGEGRNHTGLWFVQQLWWNDCTEETIRQYGEVYREEVDEPGDPYDIGELKDTIRGVLANPKRDPEARPDTKRPDSDPTVPDDWPVPDGYSFPQGFKVTEDGITGFNKDGETNHVANSPVLILGRFVDAQNQVLWAPLREDVDG